MQIILYGKPGCHLCEGLIEKLEQITHDTNKSSSNKDTNISFTLEVRDITTHEDWFAAYQYEIPVLFLWDPSRETESLQSVPRPSPRGSVQQLENLLLTTASKLLMLADQDE
ncbi:glutaredoxin family protein [Cylindrospermopsis raciborskii]|uniref:Thioredoxin family protein n=1 Tax=Cylindrospermopsis raciborskii CENA302 TaxID=1170768 RepID=A0A9Q5W989_9CYAN|nr:glutaredoxin family protein [Cylindrospermopsis raciborskii]NLQ05046.1 glutaredoxin family protein [Cylindrospermopsis raciborskii MVCC19]OHY35162.1 glutaredoxin [Cylindrospermopsis raciborskii MVCC14]OPH09700.1 thioredoxin family protein [Cylindrospermopsis raciborskii CENA302]